MFKNQSIEMFAEAKKLEMERVASRAHLVRKAANPPLRDPTKHLDIMMRVVLRPRFSIDVSLVRGLG